MRATERIARARAAWRMGVSFSLYSQRERRIGTTMELLKMAWEREMGPLPKAWRTRK